MTEFGSLPWTSESTETLTLKVARQVGTSVHTCMFMKGQYKKRAKNHRRPGCVSLQQQEGPGQMVASPFPWGQGLGHGSFKMGVPPGVGGMKGLAQLAPGTQKQQLMLAPFVSITIMMICGSISTLSGTGSIVNCPPPPKSQGRDPNLSPAS